MGFGMTPGIITDGPGADGWRQVIPLRFVLPTGQQIFKGAVLRRNLASVVGRNDTYAQFSQADLGVLSTNAAAGFVAGVAIANPATNTSGVSTPQSVGVVRQGVVPVRAAAIAGGTAVTIGSLLGFSAATGASTYDLPTVQGSYVIGAALGYVTGFQISTVLSGAVNSIGAQTVAVQNTDGVTTGTTLTLDFSTPYQEAVTPSAVTAQVKANANITVGGTFSAGTVLTATVNGVAVSYTVVAGDTNLAGAAASFAKAINASAIVNGTSAVVGPVTSAAGVVYFTALNGGTPANSVTFTTSAAGGTTTATASSATLVNGTYGTITATFLYTHAANTVVIGQNVTIGATIIPVPSATGGINVDTVLCDVAIVGA